LDLLSDSREKAEELIDFLYDPSLHEAKPRTYRRTARKCYLQTAQKKNKSRKVIRRAIRQQLQFLRRDIAIINRLLDSYDRLPFNKYQRKYFYVIQTLYAQQSAMYRTKTHTIEA
jgi:hypothetical protein